MICRKCGHDNPQETIFCEECDHRLDMPYVKKMTMPVHYTVICSLALGLIATVLGLISGQGQYIPVIAGAFGIVLGTYSLRVSREVKDDSKRTLMMLSAAAAGLSVVGFMIGITLI